MNVRSIGFGVPSLATPPARSPSNLSVDMRRFKAAVPEKCSNLLAVDLIQIVLFKIAFFAGKILEMPVVFAAIDKPSRFEQANKVFDSVKDILLTDTYRCLYSYRKNTEIW